MKLKIFAVAAALGSLLLVPRAAWCAPTTTYSLFSATHEARLEGAAPVVFAGAFDPQLVAPASWDDRLLKLHRGGYNAVLVRVPWNFGQVESLKTTELELLLDRVDKLGMKAILCPPPTGASADWKSWFTALEPVLKAQKGSILCVQISLPDKDAKTLRELVKAQGVTVPFFTSTANAVTSGQDPERPYRQPEVAAALRDAVAGGSTLLTWDSPFAGIAPPQFTETQTSPAVSTGPEVGGLSLGYYEAKLFGDVVRTLGAPLAAAKPASGTSCDVASVAVTQRNDGKQGFLFLRAPKEPVDKFHITFTDPATHEKVTVPRQEGLRLRTFGSDARILPLNMPVPGATIRYSTAEVYSIQQIAGRTVVLLTADDGALNEIALGMETAEEPKVDGSPVAPLWDAKTRTLTLGFAPTFYDMFITVGEKLVLGIIPTERAQRTWSFRYQNETAQIISSAYYVADSEIVKDKPVVKGYTQQGKTAVTLLLPSKPKYLAVNERGPKIGWKPAANALLVFLESPQIASLKTQPAAVQVFKDARFLAGTEANAADYARPAFADNEWQSIGLNKPHAAGWYRVHFQLPKVDGWHIPWKATLQLKGKATLYLNGIALGSFTAGEKDFMDISLPETALNLAKDGDNILAISVPEDANIEKLGVAPWSEHTVQEQDLVFTP